MDFKSLQLFPGNWDSWIPIVLPIFHGEILHGLLRCDLFNPQSCLLLKKPPPFLAEFEVSDGFLDGFLCLFLPFFEVFVPFSTVKSPHFSDFFEGHPSRQEKDKGPSKASRESASLAAERRPSRRLEGFFSGGWFSCWGL